MVLHVEVAAGGEGGETRTGTAPPNGSNTDGWGVVCFVVRGADTDTGNWQFEDTNNQDDAAGATGQPNAGPLTPTTEDSLSLYIGMMDRAVTGEDSTATTPPTDYTFLGYRHRNVNVGGIIGASYQLLDDSLSEVDPATWTMASANDEWAAVHLIIPPAASASAPTVTTDFASNVGAASATLHGSITATGGDDADEHGFAYSTDSGLSTGVSTTTLGAFTGTGSFSGGITGLSNDETYFFRAYATNGTDTGFGSIQNFTTGNATPTRQIRLFEGSSIKFYNGRVKLFQQ
jgi:hypothetical protein